MYRSIVLLAAMALGGALLAFAVGEWSTLAGAARPLGFMIFSLV